MTDEPYYVRLAAETLKYGFKQVCQRTLMKWRKTMTATQKFKLTAIPQPTLFTHKGMEYYLVEFKMRHGERMCTHREAKDALEAAGHIPAQIRGTEILRRREITKQKGWITLFDCRENMNDRTGFFLGRNTKAAQGLGLANPNDGLAFYHLDHGSAGEHPALCWRKV